MRDCILLRLDAPLMSFGGPVVDQEGGTRETLGRSALTGLLANALGWEHGDFEKLESLQQALVFAVRCDKPGSRLHDFQTADLGQPHMRGGWTTWGHPESRGGASSDGTHIRNRIYLAGAIYTVALTLQDGPTTLDEVESALREPARPLFLGRKACIPSVPLLQGRLQARSPLDALRTAPHPPEAFEADTTFLAWWPEGMEDEGIVNSRVLSISDDRDWANRIHSGRRLIREGRVRFKQGEAA